MIDEGDIEKAVHWLLSSADEAAEAKGERIYCEEYRKSLKAIIASECNETSEAAKERHAYAHPRYQEHLERLKQAVIRDETMRARRAAAEMKIEAWRTQSSNMRSVKL